eukprot:gene2629-3826_t
MKLIYTLLINLIFTSFLIISFNNISNLLNRNKEIIQVNEKTKIKEKVMDIKEINIFVSTLKRNETKYLYLKEQFQSFEEYFNEFKQIKLKYHAMERQNNDDINQKDDNLNLLKKSKSFYYSKFKQMKFKNQFKPKNKREKNILNQTLDFISLFNKIKKNNYCLNNSKGIFLYLEDDFILCPNSFFHFISLLKWSKNNLNRWSGIRFSIGFNGILFQCRDINHILKIIKNNCLKQPIPIDMIITNWFNSLNGETKITLNRTLFTYRFNLMKHIGVESIIGNSHLIKKRFPKCFKILYMMLFPASDYFDIWNCSNKILSPCNSLNNQFDKFKLINFPKVQIPLKQDEKLNLMKKFKIQPKVSMNNNENCVDTCKRFNLKCSSHSFPFVNDCNLMRFYFKKNCQCQSSAFGEVNSDPSISLDYYCSLQQNPIYSCNSTIKTHYPSKRLCPCKSD